ncbi:MAG: histidine phosphatase family protein [Proteobacteria bacterium]|nr:histidine phosphatase family protein [Pseudomonadota bacterium]MBU1232525.1 histidine phosphatase family protein [Pseudomonadota bacterium]MBU1420278.1 histidine phosphatase family protein [Pseudomonadota bacterium]MBU1455607.1 histidine phosphatase family protein [Pseudomonadota bacterium]
MKRLYLIRHAKSSWADPTLRDFDRPLNKRGKRDAPFMGEKLAELAIRPDFIMSSSAKRAEKTARTIAKAIAYPPKKIFFTEAIYLADENELYRIVQSCDDKVTTLFLVGHNFGITDFAVSIAGVQIDNIPTCGIAAVEFDLDSWQQVVPNSGRLLFVDWPKKYKSQR